MIPYLFLINSCYWHYAPKKHLPLTANPCAFLSKTKQIVKKQIISLFLFFITIWHINSKNVGKTLSCFLINRNNFHCLSAVGLFTITNEKYKASLNYLSQSKPSIPKIQKLHHHLEMSQKNGKVKINIHFPTFFWEQV